MYGPVGSNLEGVTLNVPTALKNAIRGKTYTELVRKPRELSLWDKIKARAGGDVRVGSDEEYIIHGVGQTRIDNMASKLTDEVLIETGDVTKQAARQIAVRMFGGTANTTQLGAQATRIEANIKRLVDSGEITLVNVTGVGDAMQVHAVSVDKLKEQLQDKIPGYIASNDNRVRNIGGIMVEYNPTINRYFILQGLSDTFSEPRFGN
jgi:polyhydroxyalkanoate synthesis regulator phasin